MNKLSNVLIIVLIIAIIFSSTSLLLSAYAEIEISTIITDNILIVSGFSDDDFVGIALKQDGRLFDTARSEVEFGHYYVEMQKPRPGIYDLLVGTSTDNKTIQIFIDVEIPDEQIIIEDLPYSGNVGPIILEPIIEEPDEIITESIHQPIGEELLPSWIKEVFVMWTNELITDVELIEAIEYLVGLGVIEV